MVSKQLVSTSNVTNSITLVGLLVGIVLTSVCAYGQPVEMTHRGVHGNSPATGRINLNVLAGQVVFTPTHLSTMYPASGIDIVVLNAAGHKFLSAKSTETGQFEFSGVGEGSYIVQFSKDSVQSLSLPVVVGPQPKPGGPEAALLIQLRSKDDPTRSSAHIIANNALRREILKRTDEDQAVRMALIKSGMDHPDKTIAAKMARIDADNLARMREVVKQLGWPGRSEVGVDGTEAAFLLVQHAQLDFQKQMLPLVEKAYRAGELHGQDFALLQDRVLMNLGKMQSYGTQANQVSKWKGHEPTLYPIEDEEHVDKRRAEVGLMPLADYIKILKAAYFPGDK